MKQGFLFTQILLLALHGFAGDVKPPAVPDEDTAIKVGEAALIRVYGRRKIESERPFKARFDKGIWTVTGTLNCWDRDGVAHPGKCDGGVAIAKVSEKSGRVVSMTHTK